MKKTLFVAAILAAVLCIGQAMTPPSVALQHGARRGSNKDMRQGIKAAHQAHELLASALHIYDYQRVDAMRCIHEGNTLLECALKGVPPPAPKLDKNGNPIPPKRIKDMDFRSKYPAADVAASDQKLRQGSELLGQAIGMLDNADPMYHGEREAAIAKFKEAQGYIAKALTIH